MRDVSETERVLKEVLKERQRQLEKWGRQTHPDHVGPELRLVGAKKNWETTALLKNFNDTYHNPYWSLILAEEFYEAVESEDLEDLRRELIEVAAVAVAWVEDLDTRDEDSDV